MAFYKPRKMKDEKWYPFAVQIDEPFTTEQLADRLAEISTVSRADVYAVLGNLPGVMADMMAQGRSVRMDGLGTFRYTINAEKKGVDTAEEVGAEQIVAVRVRYTPETRRPTKSGPVTRALVDDGLRWIRFDGKPVEDDTEEPEEPGTEPGTGGEDEDLFG